MVYDGHMDIEAMLGGLPVTIHVGSAPTVPDVYGLDVESTYLTDRAQFDEDFRVRMVQFGSESEAWVLDQLDADSQHQTIEVLSDERFAFCSHTNMDVLAVRTSLSVNIADRNIDTRMLASMVYTDKQAERDLKTLASMHGMPELKAADDELYEWMRERWVSAGGRKNAARSAVECDGWNALASLPLDELPAVFLRYAGLDAIACRRLLPILTTATVDPPELLRTERWLAVEANLIQMRGMRVDLPRLAGQLASSRDVTYLAAQDVMGVAGLPAGSPKLIPWLGEHGVDWESWPGSRTPTGAPSLAKDNLAHVGGYPLDEDGATVFAALQRHRADLDMLRKTEAIDARIVDGRIHPLLNTVGATTTARMSSSGPNLQNMSKKNPLMRGLFLPDEGHELWTIDFDQVELRVVAALAREDKMIDAILAGGDLHQLTVDELAGLGVTITRQQAKVANFLIVYGGGGKALHEQTGIPLELAYDVVSGIRKRYVAIDALTQHMGAMKEEVRTISSRRLPVTRDGDGRVRSYANVNYLVQSSARDLLVDAWHRFAVDFGHAGIVWWPVHDELVLQVPTGDPAETARIIADAETAMSMDFMGVPITATAVKLLDAEGTSRWMPADLTSWNAEKGSAA